ncbi:hypothetical protein LRS13_00975 [Svornostia abyssi]|uniref:Uncharacterized protein n=1 Tax=Svornostia abyssi TaxID=2898438 RepID=A0ABY5PI24_9ACTN|nr:hypothetical protein LRS13_00975 [Parviterribacteraceae bacterium J379]
MVAPAFGTYVGGSPRVRLLAHWGEVGEDGDVAELLALRERNGRWGRPIRLPRGELRGVWRDVASDGAAVVAFQQGATTVVRVAPPRRGFGPAVPLELGGQLVSLQFGAKGRLVAVVGPVLEASGRVRTGLEALVLRASDLRVLSRRSSTGFSRISDYEARVASDGTVAGLISGTSNAEAAPRQSLFLLDSGASDFRRVDRDPAMGQVYGLESRLIASRGRFGFLTQVERPESSVSPPIDVQFAPVLGTTFGAPNVLQTVTAVSQGSDTSFYEPSAITGSDIVWPADNRIAAAWRTRGADPGGDRTWSRLVFAQGSPLSALPSPVDLSAPGADVGTVFRTVVGDTSVLVWSEERPAVGRVLVRVAVIDATGRRQLRDVGREVARSTERPADAVALGSDFVDGRLLVWWRGARGLRIVEIPQASLTAAP